jgi:hypothetical protein
VCINFNVASEIDFCPPKPRQSFGPYILKEGDQVWVSPGGKVPFILRPHGQYFKRVGECVVAGSMKGELAQRRDSHGATDMWLL